MTQNVDANEAFGFSKQEMVGKIRQIGSSHPVRHRMKAPGIVFDLCNKSVRFVEKAIG